MPLRYSLLSASRKLPSLQFAENKILPLVSTHCWYNGRDHSNVSVPTLWCNGNGLQSCNVRDHPAGGGQLFGRGDTVQGPGRVAEEATEVVGEST